MIRINLLPAAKKAQRGAAAGGGGTTGWVVGYFGVAIATMVACGLLYLSKQTELEQQLAQNADLDRHIAEVTQESASLDEVRAALAQSHELEEVVNELQRARFGPTRVLVELSRILSLGGGPSIDPERLEALRQANPLAGYNRSWDARRLWLVSFEEEARSVRIHGAGRTHEDVAEFLRRLALSDSFGDVHLERTEAGEDAETHLPIITFALTASVRY